MVYPLSKTHGMLEEQVVSYEPKAGDLHVQGFLVFFQHLKQFITNKP